MSNREKGASRHQSNPFDPMNVDRPRKKINSENGKPRVAASAETVGNERSLSTYQELDFDSMPEDGFGELPDDAELVSSVVLFGEDPELLRDTAWRFIGGVLYRAEARSEPDPRGTQSAPKHQSSL